MTESKKAERPREYQRFLRKRMQKILGFCKYDMKNNSNEIRKRLIKSK